MIRLAAILALVLSLAACGPAFKPQSEVDHPRILGITAVPPEPAFDGTTALEAVVAFPEKLTVVSWAACPLSLGAELQYACATPEIPMPEKGLTARFSGMLFQPFLAALGPMFPQLVGFLREIVQQKEYCLRDMLTAYDACSSASAPDAKECIDPGVAATVKCLRQDGLDITFHLVLKRDDGAILQAYRRARFRDATAAKPANQVPTLAGVQVDGAALLVGGETVEALPGETLRLRPVFAPGAVETYRSVDGADTKENLFVSWYATAGSFDHTRSTPEYPDASFTMADASQPQAEATVWVFTYDDRLGVSWLAFKVRPKGWAPDAVAGPDATRDAVDGGAE